MLDSAPEWQTQFSLKSTISVAPQGLLLCRSSASEQIEKIGGTTYQVIVAHKKYELLARELEALISAGTFKHG
ncbi:MAG TPA: hypothetical protein VLJ86_26990, partial [Ramlibacter sp.]|nr:hypothetical protein [Ramlibacter sp.]